MEVKSFDPILDEVRVIIEDNFEVEGYGRCSEPVCHFTRGVLCGAASVIFGGDFEVKEVACKAQGDSVCEFLIKRKK